MQLSSSAGQNNLFTGSPTSTKVSSNHYSTMESMIHTFKLQSEGPTVSEANTYPNIDHCYQSTIECPKGSYSTCLFLDSNQPERPYRLSISPNDFLMVSYLNEYIHQINLADGIAVLGSIDFVLGSVDKSSLIQPINRSCHSFFNAPYGME